MKRRAGFRVDHPTLGADPILEVLGATPSVAQSLAAPQVTPKGESLTGTYRATYLYFDLGEPSSIADAVLRALAFATEHERGVKFITNSGGSLQLLVHQDFSETNGMELQASELAALASHSIGFGFDLLGSRRGP
jgi:hypothetical protein